jgi:UTP-glucose-1-phosphate uridylyltransferase
MKPTLVILAAGMASRYGAMKQVEGFGPNGETIMDYSIYSAIKAGFGKVVFIIREDFAEAFKAQFEPKLAGKIKTDYVYQSLSSFVAPEDLPADRTKPWGTGHAMLCAKDAVQEPFAIINADDHYGNDAFEKAAAFLTNESATNLSAIIGYKLANTLSDHGTVSRGVCQVDANSMLTDITERTKIYRENGTIVYEDENGKTAVSEDAHVSMNFWCFHPSIFNLTNILFKSFPKENIGNLKAEFFIPIIADYFIKQFDGNIKVIETGAKWFGVTYKEDAPVVKDAITGLIAAGDYPANLW